MDLGKLLHPKKELMCELPEEKDLICGFKTFKGKKTCQKHLCIAYCYHKKLRHKEKEIL